METTLLLRLLEKQFKEWSKQHKPAAYKKDELLDYLGSRL